ncbi:hypothetical protein KCP77_24675 (plasmid) [Salmonella enterica subsp. enterica]|nr:hypothetical protein KCP77_24675 [Salmonella enterica subsp. enterica]
MAAYTKTALSVESFLLNGLKQRMSVKPVLKEIVFIGKSDASIKKQNHQSTRPGTDIDKTDASFVGDTVIFGHKCEIDGDGRPPSPCTIWKMK